MLIRMPYGTVVRTQVPLVMTFDEEAAAFVCDSLAESLEISYKIIDFFQFDPDLDPWNEDENE